MADIAHGKLDGEFHRSQHEEGKNIPTQQVGDEEDGSGGLSDQSVSGVEKERKKERQLLVGVGTRTIWRPWASSMFRWASCQYEPASRQNPVKMVANRVTYMTFVRSEQIMKINVGTPMKTSANAVDSHQSRVQQCSRSGRDGAYRTRRGIRGSRGLPAGRPRPRYTLESG